MATHRLQMWLLLVLLPLVAACPGDDASDSEAAPQLDVDDTKSIGDDGSETGGDPNDDINWEGDEDSVNQDTTFTSRRVPALDVDGDAEAFSPAAAAIFELSADGEVSGKITVSIRIGESAPPGIAFNLCAVLVERADGSADIAEGLVINAEEETGKAWASFVVDGSDIFTLNHDGALFLVVPADLGVSVDTTPDAGEVGDVFTTTVDWGVPPTDEPHAHIAATCIVCLDSSTEHEVVPGENPCVSFDLTALPLTTEVRSVCTGNTSGVGIVITATDLILTASDEFECDGTGTPQPGPLNRGCFRWEPLVIRVSTLAPCTGDVPVVLAFLDQAEQVYGYDEFLDEFVQGNGSIPVVATVAYKDGAVIADLTSGTVLLTLDHLEDNLIGSVPMSFVPPSPQPRVDALVSYHNLGYGITHYDPAFGEFGATEIDPSSGSVSDVDNYEEDPSRAVLVQSGRNQVRFVELATDPFSGSRFRTVDTLVKNIPAGLFPGATGYVITASRRNDTSPVYFVTVGATPTDPGQLWRKNDPADLVTPATALGAVGATPRRIRFEGPVGVVSNNGSDTLTILTRDASDNVAIKGTVNVGDGPIGVDLLVLPNGNIGVLSTGFLGNTYTVTILEPDGDVVSNETSPVPDGGLNPGHAVWANAEGTRIAVSCNGSDEVKIFSIG